MEAQGELFGRYRLLEKIGTGGMAEVFLAKMEGPEGFERRLAIKRILPHYSKNASFVRMFVDEARLVGHFSHPNIVQVIDFGKINGAYYLAMEYVDGVHVADILTRYKKEKLRLPPEVIIEIGLQACRGMDYAHRETDENGKPLGIIHRDLTPHNIMVSRKGIVKITDFGIAKASMNTHMTQAGMIKGKVPYMSPEQAMGLPLTHVSDIFSIGIVLYEMCVLKRLFEGENDFVILQKVQSAKIEPIRNLNPDIPEELERIILKALTKDRNERYAWANEMEADLTRLKFTLSDASARFQLGPWIADFIDTYGKPGLKGTGQTQDADDDDDEALMKTVIEPRRRFGNASSDVKTRMIKVESDGSITSWEGEASDAEDRADVSEHKGEDAVAQASTSEARPENPVTDDFHTPSEASLTDETMRFSSDSDAPPSSSDTAHATEAPAASQAARRDDDTLEPLDAAALNPDTLEIQQEARSDDEQPTEHEDDHPSTRADSPETPPDEVDEQNEDARPEAESAEPKTGESTKTTGQTKGKKSSAKPPSRTWRRLAPAAALLAVAGIIWVMSAAKTGSITITTRPPDATIFINSRKVADHSPYVYEGIPLGTTLQVAARKEGFRDATRNVQVRDGDPKTIRLKLAPLAFGSLIVESNPPGAKVLMGGRKTHFVTPCKLELEAGIPYQLTFAIDDKHTRSGEYVVKKDEQKTITIDFGSDEAAPDSKDAGSDADSATPPGGNEGAKAVEPPANPVPSQADGHKRSGQNLVIPSGEKSAPEADEAATG